MIKTVLFDVDGVLLSEERYFDASALTVWEMLHSDNYLGIDPNQFKTNFSDDEIDSIRSSVFHEDEVLEFMKSCGLNANWDMIYLTFSYQLIRLLEQVKETDHEIIKKWVASEIDRDVLLEMANVLKGKDLTLYFSDFLDDFQATERSKDGLLSHLDELAIKKLDVSTSTFGTIGALWSACELVSQEWYVGDEHVLTSTGRASVQRGKKGFLSDERVLAPIEEIENMFESLKNAGIRIGIGTGRPELEVIEPFKHLGWFKHFDKDYIVTADDVLAAERELSDGSTLAKPHPYTYLLAVSGKRKSVQECVQQSLPLEDGAETLIVGDSLADLLAARQMGASFAAVLTGLSGQDAREQFEKYEAKHIFNGVLDIKDFVLSSVKS